MTARRVRRRAPREHGLFDAMLDLFGAAFDEPKTYGARRPSPGYRERLLGRDSFVALVTTIDDEVVGAQPPTSSSSSSRNAATSTSTIWRWPPPIDLAVAGKRA